MPALYAILSVIAVSLVSLVGILFLTLNKNTLNKILLFLVSLSAGSLFGGAFLHLLPEVVEKKGLTLSISLSVLVGLLLFFALEKFIHWHNCYHNHDASCKEGEEKPKHLAVMNLVGDAIHNFIDGLIIAAGYLTNVHLGFATTLAVVLHEIPQEIGDFGVLIYSGLSKGKALFYNLLSALFAVLGAIIGLIIGTASEQFVSLILPFAAGGFIYIAGSDLIPELHKKCHGKDTFWHFFALILGIILMVLLRFLEF